jgi:hypothetical protein
MLLTNDLRQQLPSIDAVKESGFGLFDAPALAKFLTPGDRWTWYAVAFDGEDLCFGFINGNVPELGCFRLSELEHGWGIDRRPVVRDPDYQPVPLRAVLRDYVRLAITAR